MFGAQCAVDHQSGLCARFSNEPNDSFVVGQGLSAPLLTDLAKEAMLDGIPLRSSSRIMADSDAKLIEVHQFLLEPGVVVDRTIPTRVERIRDARPQRRPMAPTIRCQNAG
jgi:hypothetical protein